MAAHHHFQQVQRVGDHRIELDGGDPHSEGAAPAKVEPLGDMLCIGQDLGLGGVLLGPLPVLLQLVGESVGIPQALHVAAGAGVAVPVPDSSGSVGGVQGVRIDPLLAQPVQAGSPANPRPITSASWLRSVPAGRVLEVMASLLRRPVASVAADNVRGSTGPHRRSPGDVGGVVSPWADRTASHEASARRDTWAYPQPALRWSQRYYRAELELADQMLADLKQVAAHHVDTIGHPAEPSTGRG